MLKQIVVDKVMARQLWKLGFKEPTLSYYDVDGQFFDGRSGKSYDQALMDGIKQAIALLS